MSEPRIGIFLNVQQPDSVSPRTIVDQAVAHTAHPFTPGIQLGHRQAWRGLGAVGIPGLVGLHQVGRGFEPA